MEAALNALIRKYGQKSTMPDNVSPMLCTLTKEVIDNPAYLYEVKWDGYRIISYANKGTVKMVSRSGLDYTKKYPPVGRALTDLKANVVLDGEVLVLNDSGKTDFDALQKFNGHETPIYYYAFDILWLEGYDLMEVSLIERKKILQLLIKGNDIIRYSDHFDDGPQLFAEMEKNGIEGIVAKLERHPDDLTGQKNGNRPFSDLQ